MNISFYFLLNYSAINNQEVMSVAITVRIYDLKQEGVNCLKGVFENFFS